MANELRIVITSPPEREDFVAEIWDEDIFIGSVEPKQGAVVFAYIGGDELPHDVEFDTFIAALQRAKENL